MTDKIVPLVDVRKRAFVPSIEPSAALGQNTLGDARQRRLHDLRISVTDRCNFRCVYCMPKEVFNNDYPYLKHDELLSFEEITKLAKAFVSIGVEKLRLTGGEPLLRKNVETLIAMLAELRTPAGQPVDLTLTTNASLLSKKARALKAAGLNRITVSLDAMDDEIFNKMNDVDCSVEQVLEGLDAATAAGFCNIKVNMVVKKGWNEDQVVPMARHFKNSPHIVRFIEYMDVGNSNGWKLDEVMPSKEVISKIHNEVAPLVTMEPNYQGEVAQRWKYADGSNEVGVISSVTQAFCSTCTRARLSTQGQLYTCLFASQGHDFKALLRGPLASMSEPDSDAALRNAIANVWGARSDRYSELRTAASFPSDRIEMSYIGG